MPENAQASMTQRVRDLIDGYQSTCVLLAAAELGIFERLASEPREISDLARNASADERALRRLIRALVSYGLVAADGSRVALTDAGRLFLEGNGAAELLLLVGEQYFRAWSHLSYSVRSGKPAFENVFGVSAWEHRRRNPSINAAFNSVVALPQRFAAATILSAFDFSRFRSVADIGGGNGYLLAGILQEHSALTGLLFDLPHVVASAVWPLRSAGVAHRCETMPGSFFERLPPGFDLYVLQYILHDWDDEQCATILTRCREAMSEGGRLLILEKVRSEDELSMPRGLVMRDLHMMVVLGGRERTLAEYDELLGAAGLRRTSYVPLAEGSPDIMEVEAVR